MIIVFDNVFCQSGYGRISYCHKRKLLSARLRKIFTYPNLREYLHKDWFTWRARPPCQKNQIKSTSKFATPWFLVTETYSIVFLQQRLLSVSVDVRWGKSRIESARDHGAL